MEFLDGWVAGALNRGAWSVVGGRSAVGMVLSFLGGFVCIRSIGLAGFELGRYVRSRKFEKGELWVWWVGDEGGVILAERLGGLHGI